MSPGHEQLDESIINHSFLFQHFQDIGSEQLCKGTDIKFRHHKKLSTLKVETVGNHGMEMRMPVGIVAECLNNNDYPWYALLFTKDCFEKLCQTFGSTLTKLTEQLPIVEEKTCAEFWV